MPDESVLRAAFHELRAVERAQAPPFGAAVLRGRRGRRPSMGVIHAFSAAMLAVVVLLTFAVLIRTREPAPIPSPLAGWTAPTDFLLNTPQADLLRTVPRFGERNVIR